MRFIRVNIECKTEDYNDTIAEAGGKQDVEFREGLVCIDHVSSFYRSASGGTFIHLNNMGCDEHIFVEEGLDIIEMKLANHPDIEII